MSTISEYYALRPAEYGPIVRQLYSQYQCMAAGEDVMRHELELVLAKDPSLSGDRLVLHFRGVSKLRFSQPSWSLAAFGLLELHECESGFRATEEEGHISFCFTSFEARLEKAADA